MLCSTNVHPLEVKRLSELLGVPLTESLGKYLGHRALYKGINVEGHKELVECVQGRLEGWKIKCLSRAGRLTLAQSVLTSLPIFQMQLEKLPTWVHKALDRAVRCCLWEDMEARGVCIR